MGGLGSGGPNKTHGQVEQRRWCRVDSFRFWSLVRFDKYLDYKEKVDIRTGPARIRYYLKTREAEILEDGYYCPVELSWVNNIDGHSQRLYFICPCCGERVRYFYRNYSNGFYMCRKCCGLNYKSQQVGVIDELLLKMKRIVEDKLGYYNWYMEYGCIADLWTIPKPPYMHCDKYSRLLKEFKRLQSEYEVEMRKALLGSLSSRRLLWKYINGEGDNEG